MPLSVNYKKEKKMLRIIPVKKHHTEHFTLSLTLIIFHFWAKNLAYFLYLNYAQW